MISPLVGVPVSVILAAAAYRKGVFDLRGASLAGFLGVAISVFTDLRWLALLLLFVILGTTATNFALEWKARNGLSEGSDGKRTGRNVLANGGVPLVLVLASGSGAWQDGYLLALYSGAVATATADTLSSEVGVLSSTTRMITAPWRTVEAGVDGGVSGLGELSAAVGAATIAAVTAALFSTGYALPVAVGGFLGCQVDSIAGAILERRGLLNNEAVNVLATATGAAVALLVYLYAPPLL